jgi:thiosulfate reductase cytochrome b subunit
MAATTSPGDGISDARPPARLHPLALRIMHWLNAMAMLILILSGWAIYNDEVLFGWLHFPHWMTLGDGPEGALQWHFLAMWILGINGLAYLGYGLATGRFRRMLLPIGIGEVVAEMRAALALRLSHEDLTRYNAVQRLLYLGIILIGIVQVLSGLAVWKPVQFSELAILFGDFQTARLIHFLGMAAIVGFLIVHVALALIVPRTLLAMVTGGPLVARDPPCAAEPVPAGRQPMPSEPPGEPMPMETASPTEMAPMEMGTPPPTPPGGTTEPVADPQPMQDQPGKMAP